jgi:hypothetical protein
MERILTIPDEVAFLIPSLQLEFTKKNLREFSNSILKLKAQLKKCPKLKETYYMEEHPVVFHYFVEDMDIFICEFDRINEMYGFMLISGKPEKSAWKFVNLIELLGIEPLKIDYYFEEQSIEAVLYKAYPNYFKRPKSLSILGILKTELVKRIKRWPI